MLLLDATRFWAILVKYVLTSSRRTTIADTVKTIMIAAEVNLLAGEIMGANSQVNNTAMGISAAADENKIDVFIFPAPSVI